MFTFDDLERRVSSARTGTYLRAVDGDRVRALALYEWHARLTGALFTVVADIEIVVRNAMHDQLTTYHDSKRSSSTYRWFDEPAWFPTRLGWFHYQALKDIERAKKHTRDRGPGYPRAPAGKVVAELSLGFWKFLLSPHYEASFWSPALRHAFPGAPPTTTRLGREQVYRPIERLHALRNRLAHHEPVLQPIRTQRWPAADVATIIAEATEVVSWIDTETAAWIESRNEVGAMLAKRP